ncbi:MAG: N-acetylmuramoyl-L-alanine amidase [Deltaproteobacteria bacterium]|nr:N-acetylmuramoyl-L-alanine amidase [Deltaproteobacteria bacterium]
MKTAWMARLAAAAAALATAAAWGEAVPQALVERVRYIGTVSYSRVVVDLSAPVEFRLTPVLPEGGSGPPDRLVVDLAGARIGPEAREPLSVGDALVRGIRTGQYTAGTARVVLDLAAAAEARAFTLPDPYRLVIDLKGKAAAAPTQAAKIRRLDTARADDRPAESRREAAPDPPRAAGKPAVERAAPPATTAAKRFQVVIDPGHGGKDPGARGFGGLEEKDLVLSVSRRLAALLRADPAIDVALTRSDDRYLSLEERTGFANAQGADLFVSVHANASANPSLRGVEVYYLNNTDNRGTLRLAAMENNLRWDPRNSQLQAAIPDLSYILSDLRQTYKVEESKQLAEHLQGAVVSRLQERYEGVDDLGVKEGPFYVLVGAYMPCVLVEVSFLTHPVEGRRLGTSTYQETLADGIFRGIRRYLSQTKLAKTL